MNKPQKAEIRQLIRDDEIKQAIARMYDLLPAQRKLLDKLSARYQRLRQQKSSGVISFEQEQLAKNQIVDTLIEILGDPEGFTEQKETGKGTNNWWKYVTGLAVLISILAGLAELTGYPLREIIGNKPAPESRQLTVFVHGAEGRQDYLLKNEGEIVLTMGNDRRVLLIGQSGRTNFGEIGVPYGTEIGLSLRAEGFEAVNPDSQYIYNGKPIFLEVKSSCRFCKLSGTVQRENQLLAGAVVMVKGTQLADTTNVNGLFSIDVPPGMEQEEYTVIVQKGGVILWDDYVTPSPGVPIEILINK